MVDRLREHYDLHPEGTADAEEVVPEATVTLEGENGASATVAVDIVDLEAPQEGT